MKEHDCLTNRYVEKSFRSCLSTLRELGRESEKGLENRMQVLVGKRKKDQRNWCDFKAMHAVQLHFDCDSNEDFSQAD